MPYLRLYSPEMTREQKRDAARKLTDTFQKALHLPTQARSEIIVHFMPYQLDNMAEGGILLSDAPGSIICRLLVVGFLTREKRKALNRELTPLLACLLNIAPDQMAQIQILFHSIEPHDLSFGGKFYDDLPT